MGDIINAFFELLGILFVLDHCRVLRKDKKVNGVSKISVAFFTIWGAWNLYYYPSLDQWFSFVGALGIMIANLIWLLLIIKYRGK